jgi:hypothetical protein
MLWGRVPALPANKSLGCEGLPGTNTQAYYENTSITDRKGFITLAPFNTKLLKKILLYQKSRHQILIVRSFLKTHAEPVSLMSVETWCDLDLDEKLTRDRLSLTFYINE